MYFENRIGNTSRILIHRIHHSSKLGVVEYESVRRSISEANHLRSRCQRVLNEDWFTIGKYATVHGPMAPVKKFKTKFPYLEESTVKHSVINTLKRNMECSLSVKKLSTMTSGRPLMLG